MPTHSLKIILLLLAFTLVYRPAAGQSVSTTFQDALQCKGRPLQVPYNVSGAFNTGNIFSVELSDATGSFASPVVIGSAAATTAGSISCTIPAAMPTGSSYRIRMTASNPAYTSANNGVDLHVNDVPAKPTAGSNSPVCSNRELHLTGSSSTPGVSYSWVGPFSFVSNQQNPVIANMPPSPLVPLSYVLQTTLNGCTSEPDTANVLVNLTASKPVLTSNSPVCNGGTLLLVSASMGSTATYLYWTGPNLFSDTTIDNHIFFYPVTHNDTGYYYVSVSYTFVNCPSDTVQIHVSVADSVTPSVSIVATPGLNISPWATVNFTATPTNGGTAPSYQWLRNGLPVPGATAASWSSYSLADNDAISLIMTSNEPCAVPPTDTSNILVVHVNTGIDDHSNNTANIQLYPNPNNGDFTIKGDLSEAVSIEVVNAIGQTVYSSQLTVGSQQSFAYPIHLDVASGVYLLKVAGDNGVEMVRFRVE